MDTICFQDDGGPRLRFYENKPIEDTEDEMRLNGLPLLYLPDQNTEAKIERRRHKRFQAKEHAIALIRPTDEGLIEIQGRSMGEIACSMFRAKPIKLGRINNISLGGAMLDYVESKPQTGEALVLDLIVVDGGFFLENMLFKIIADVEIVDDLFIGPVKMRQLRMQFRHLTSNQKSKLEYFIWNHCSGI